MHLYIYFYRLWNVIITETCWSNALTIYMYLMWCICWYNKRKNKSDVSLAQYDFSVITIFVWVAALGHFLIIKTVDCLCTRSSSIIRCTSFYFWWQLLNVKATLLWDKNSASLHLCSIESLQMLKPEHLLHVWWCRGHLVCSCDMGFIIVSSCASWWK